MPFSWVGRFNIVMSYLLKLIYRSETIPTKIPPFFGRNCPSNSKIYMEMQRTWNIQRNLENANKVERIVLSNFKIYYKSTVIKTVWCWQMDGQLDQCNRIHCPETDSYL